LLEEKVVLTGWGVFDQTDEMSSNLLFANLTTKSLSECRQIIEDSSFSTRLNPWKHLCAQSLSSQDACRGDAGGKPFFTDANCTY
jgi:secreted trypsin-like serine protease